MDFSILYGPAYSVFGVDAELTTAAGVTKTLRVIDKTKGVEIAFEGHSENSRVTGRTNIGTLRAAFDVLASNLSENGLGTADLLSGLIVINGQTWEIKNLIPIGGPNGETGGEIRYFLLTHNEGSA